MPGITNLSNLIERYFSSSLWLVVFAISIAYLFLRMNIARKKAVLAAVIIFLLFVNGMVIKWFTVLGENGTFYRHLWAIPSMVIIGIAIVDIIVIIPRWILKLPVVVGFVILLWFINSHEYIRCREQILSIDSKMVSEEVIELGTGFEELRDESGKQTLFVVCPIYYQHSYGSMPTELNLLYGCINISDSSLLNGLEHNGETELIGNNPDVSYIMATCCSKGMDYVIVSRNKEIERIFRENGFVPEFYTKSLMVYKCAGYKGYIQDNTNFGKTRYRSYYNEKGEPKTQSDGYCTVRYMYDGSGNRVEELYYDTDGNPCNIALGYAGKKYEYNNRNKCTKVTYINQIGEPINTDAGYAFEEYSYYSNGLIETEKYLDKEGNLVLVYGCYGIRYEYNENKKITRVSYYNQHGELMNKIDKLFASRTIIYNENDKVIGEQYYDTNDKLTITSAGYAFYKLELDSNGRIILESYYGVDEKPIRISDGYAAIKKTYNENGNQTSETYLDEDGNLVLNSKGFAYKELIYNDLGLVEEEKYYDAENRLVLCQAGYAIIRRTWNERKQLLKESYFDVDGNPVDNIAGVAVLERRYNELELIEELKWDANGNSVE